jgi:hypothetical protein
MTMAARFRGVAVELERWRFPAMAIPLLKNLTGWAILLVTEVAANEVI